MCYLLFLFGNVTSEREIIYANKKRKKKRKEKLRITCCLRACLRTFFFFFFILLWNKFWKSRLFILPPPPFPSLHSFLRRRHLPPPPFTILFSILFYFGHTDFLFSTLGLDVIQYSNDCFHFLSKFGFCLRCVMAGVTKVFFLFFFFQERDSVSSKVTDPGRLRVNFHWLFISCRVFVIVIRSQYFDFY